MLISPAYRDLNATLHADPAFGDSGRLFGRVVRDITRADPGIKTALDYGCGKGTLKGSVPGVAWSEYDPAVPGKDAPPLPADLVCCTEVLEHVEPECLEAVLAHLHALTRRLCFMTVCHVAALKTLPDGRNAHLIQEGEPWWRERMGKWFTLVAFEQKEHDNRMMVMGIPKRGEHEPA